jgi:hypothetical protein
MYRAKACLHPAYRLVVATPMVRRTAENRCVEEMPSHAARDVDEAYNFLVKIGAKIIHEPREAWLQRLASGRRLIGNAPI